MPNQSQLYDLALAVLLALGPVQLQAGEFTTCTSHDTGYNDRGGGNPVYLDRHNVDCAHASIAPDSALHRFKIDVENGDRVRYSYECCAARNGLTSCDSFETGNFDLDGNNWGALANAGWDSGTGTSSGWDSCTANQAMSQWKFAPSGGQFKIEHKCCDVKAGLRDCSVKTTGMNGIGNDIMFLDRHNLECDADQIMADWVQRTDGSNAQFAYTCCKTGLVSPCNSVTCTGHGTCNACAKTYQFWKFDGGKKGQFLRDPGGNSLQISELSFYDFNMDLIPVSTATEGSTSATGVWNPDGNSDGDTADAGAKLFDGSTATKYLDFNKGAFIINFGSSVTPVAYDWATGHDWPDRDPVKWTLSGSNDGASWTDLDHPYGQCGWALGATGSEQVGSEGCTSGRARSGVGSWEECRDYCDNECTNCAGFAYNSGQSECFMNHGYTGSGAPFQATLPGSGWHHFFNGRLCRERPYYHRATTARSTFQGPFSICTGEPMLAGAPVPSARASTARSMPALGWC